MASWLDSILVGALGSGVNNPTLILLNVVIALAYASLILLLLASIYSNPALVPHVLVLIVLATGLWISINWFIANVGLVDAETQKEELFGKQAEDSNADEPAEPTVADSKKSQ
mmetsp:Transcript_11161/g.24048  ORF Transcript_11161/g.24048 Transcript_11161/m.24048 type:complete len:113 (+) Transcript_11161:15-353(+)